MPYGHQKVDISEEGEDVNEYFQRSEIVGSRNNAGL